MSAVHFLAWLDVSRAISPELAGLTVGAFVGVVGFLLVLVLVGRSERRGERRPVHAGGSADEIVFIPPYETVQRETPLPSQVFEASPGFRPSSALSARVFAKMAAPADESAFFDHQVELPAPAPPPAVKALVSPPAVTVSPVVVISAPSRSSVPFTDLCFEDDSPTEIGEPCFDVDDLPQSRCRAELSYRPSATPSAPLSH